MKRYYLLRIQKGGRTLYCSDVKGFPVDLSFADPFSSELPFQFATEADAAEMWRLYRRNKPADADGWVYHVEEHII